MDEESPTTTGGQAIRTILYKSIPEDHQTDGADSQSLKKFSAAELRLEAANGKKIKPLQASLNNLKQNFSFEYSYPAVIFDKVCFHIDRHQQEANFLDECLFKLKRTLSCIRSSSGRNNQEEKIEILKSINLSVPYGSIFGLLGPSSCGKTTLLRCLVGLLRPSSGSIRLFCECSEDFDGTGADNAGSNRCFACCGGGGGRNGANHDDDVRRNRCKVPGQNVGYMPQDLGLYQDFTILQLLTMFGRYMQMGTKLIETRVEFMVKFLDLPQIDRQISSLSGGQKRRVSFAIACLHMPPLIILDEPTVGVDPLLRKSIWKYLRRLADEENKTIIITTHYIEEAAQADQVALMRAGEILIQDTPTRIMENNDCKTLEEAFLKICNNVEQKNQQPPPPPEQQPRYKLYPQPKFTWHNNFKPIDGTNKNGGAVTYDSYAKEPTYPITADSVANKSKVIEKLAVNGLKTNVIESAQNCNNNLRNIKLENKISNKNKILSLEPNSNIEFDQENTINRKKQLAASARPNGKAELTNTTNKNPSRGSLWSSIDRSKLIGKSINGTIRSFRGQKFVINDINYTLDSEGDNYCDNYGKEVGRGRGAGGGREEGGGFSSIIRRKQDKLSNKFRSSTSQSQLYGRMAKTLILYWALLYKNYRRNVNSLPLLAFQFMLPVIQMISFSLCVGGRPTNIGLGLVNHDQPLAQFNRSHLLSPSLLINATIMMGGHDNINMNTTTTTTNTTDNSTSPILDEELLLAQQVELLSDRYLSFVDQSMITIKPYDNLQAALKDVREAKLWAAMEISENFTSAILRRFDLENFYQLDVGTIKQSVIRLYPDRSNKVLDMICHRSLVNSYRKFLLDQFEHFRRLPIEIKEPIFSIKPNLISNSIDGYTESIAAGLLASLTYIMAAGLTTFIMVVERSAGILERTFTSGIKPVAYLIAHAAFRSVVMMLQIALVLFLTFYILQQPLVGSIWLAYAMLMTLNLTGISYGLLISSIVTDQNGAALTIVSSLVVKITLSGILWPFEAIPRWLRIVCYIQPLTMPIQALKSITLKGATLSDRTVQLGFLVSLTWLLLFLTISAKRFKFYQH